MYLSNRPFTGLLDSGLNLQRRPKPGGDFSLLSDFRRRQTIARKLLRENEIITNGAVPPGFDATAPQPYDENQGLCELLI